MVGPAHHPARRRAFILALGLFGVLLAGVTVAALARTGVLAPRAPREILRQQIEHVAANPERPTVLIVGDSFLERSWPFKRVLGRDLKAYLERRGVNPPLQRPATRGGKTSRC